MNSEIFGGVVVNELHGAVEGDHFGGHARSIGTFSHVEIVEDHILEGELGMGGSADEPEEEDEEDKEDKTREQDKENHVDVRGYRVMERVFIVFMDDVNGSPRFGGFMGTMRMWVEVFFGGKFVTRRRGEELGRGVSGSGGKSRVERGANRGKKGC